MIIAAAAASVAYNIAYIVHCLKRKRFRSVVGMTLLSAAILIAAISLQLSRL